MTQFHTDPNAEPGTTDAETVQLLPNARETDGAAITLGEAVTQPGWYWRYYCPVCDRGIGADGPFTTEALAIADAQKAKP